MKALFLAKLVAAARLAKAEAVRPTEAQGTWARTEQVVPSRVRPELLEIQAVLAEQTAPMAMPELVEQLVQPEWLDPPGCLEPLVWRKAGTLERLERGEQQVEQVEQGEQQVEQLEQLAQPALVETLAQPDKHVKKAESVLEDNVAPWIWHAMMFVVPTARSVPFTSV
jgi:hypothetical protein